MTILPERCSFIVGATALQLWIVPNRFMPVTSSSRSGGTSVAVVSAGLPRPPPALATRMSIRPQADTTSAAIANTASRSPMSNSKPIASPPPALISSTVLSAVIAVASPSNSAYEFRSRSATATRAPRPASRRA